MPYVRAGGPTPPPPTYAPTPQYASGPVYAPSAPMPSYAGPGFASAPTYGAPPAWPADIGLVVPQFAVEIGDLPRICVISGVPTDNMVRQRWSWAPGWTLLLGAILRYTLSDRVGGFLPIAPAVRRRHATMVVGCVVGFMAGFIALLAGLAGNQPVAAVVGLVLFLGCPVLLGRKGSLVKVKRAAPGYLAIKNASPEFARAFQAGRPVGVAPHVSRPEPYTRKAVLVAAVVIGVLMVLGLIANLVSPDDGCGCQSLPAIVHVGPPVVQTHVTGLLP
jgi:hypothetical protein